MPKTRLTFGPLPSRRLGQSLGINHIPAKHCTYACVYCQVGRTTHLGIERQTFYSPDRILDEVETRLNACRKAGIPVEVLTLVPDGEPTLDLNLGRLISRLKPLGFPIAVITNASLIFRPEIQEDLLAADWISLKLDTVDEAIWTRINRPHPRLTLTSILDGMLAFREKYAGTLTTETMLVAGLNDHEGAVRHVGEFLRDLQPHRAYLAVPTRPPTEPWVTTPAPEALATAMRICAEYIPAIEGLFEAEQGPFMTTGDLTEDILSMAAVHPLREDVLKDMLRRAQGSWKIVEDLLATGDLRCITYRGERFYLRRIKP